MFFDQQSTFSKENSSSKMLRRETKSGVGLGARVMQVTTYETIIFFTKNDNGDI